MLGVWGDTEKSVIKSQLKKTFIFIYLISLFALFLYTWLFPSSFVHFFIALRLYALHPLLGKGKGLPSSVHFFTYLHCLCTLDNLHPLHPSYSLFCTFQYCGNVRMTSLTGTRNTWEKDFKLCSRVALAYNNRLLSLYTRNRSLEVVVSGK
jgi:hypothetical protein